MEDLSFIAAPSMVASSHRKPPSPRDICAGQDSDKRNNVYFELRDCIHVNYKFVQCQIIANFGNLYNVSPPQLRITSLALGIEMPACVQSMSFIVYVSTVGVMKCTGECRLSMRGSCHAWGNDNRDTVYNKITDCQELGFFYREINASTVLHATTVSGKQCRSYVLYVFEEGNFFFNFNDIFCNSSFQHRMTGWK